MSDRGAGLSSAWLCIRIAALTYGAYGVQNSNHFASEIYGRAGQVSTQNKHENKAELRPPYWGNHRINPDDDNHGSIFAITASPKLFQELPSVGVDMICSLSTNRAVFLHM